MFKKLRNKKAIVETSFLLVLALTTGLIGRGFYVTYKNGVLKNNGKIVWCKMQNKGAEFCNNQYLPFPKEEVN